MTAFGAITFDGGTLLVDRPFARTLDGAVWDARASARGARGRGSCSSATCGLVRCASATRDQHPHEKRRSTMTQETSLEASVRDVDGASSKDRTSVVSKSIGRRTSLLTKLTAVAS